MPDEEKYETVKVISEGEKLSEKFLHLPYLQGFSFFKDSHK